MKLQRQQQRQQECICAVCGGTGKEKEFCELDNKGSEEWCCKECAFDLDGCCDCDCEECKND